MITRRALNTGLGLTAATALMASAAKAQIAFADVPKGPWTKSGMVGRAGGQLHYAMLGTPRAGQPPVVLLHKLGGWMADWRFVAAILAKDRQVIAFDLPGHGDSKWLGAPPYIQSLGETAALLVGAFDELGLSQVDLVGTSLGGCAAVPLAAFWPERVRKLSLVSSALGGKRTLAEIKTNIDEKQTALYDAAGMPVPNDAQILAKIFGIIHVESISAEGNSSRRQAGRWIQPSERGVAITDIKGTLARVSAPTLLLYGDRDHDYTKFREGAEAALKDVRTEYVPQSGAFVMQDNPPATAAILKAWLDKA